MHTDEFWVFHFFKYGGNFQKYQNSSIFHFLVTFFGETFDFVFFKVHFFRRKFSENSKIFNFSWKNQLCELFSNFQNLSSTGTFFSAKFSEKFRFFMKKHPLCELFSIFQNLKLSIMMLSPRSKQTQQADSLVDSDLKK